MRWIADVSELPNLLRQGTPRSLQCFNRSLLDSDLGTAKSASYSFGLAFSTGYEPVRALPLKLCSSPGNFRWSS